jgi:soluble lytic murein transglycosylase-like protein
MIYDRSLIVLFRTRGRQTKMGWLINHLAAHGLAAAQFGGLQTHQPQVPLPSKPRAVETPRIDARAFRAPATALAARSSSAALAVFVSGWLPSLPSAWNELVGPARASAIEAFPVDLDLEQATMLVPVLLALAAAGATESDAQF